MYIMYNFLPHSFESTQISSQTSAGHPPPVSSLSSYYINASLIHHTKNMELLHSDYYPPWNYYSLHDLKVKHKS